jgi:hypothetical protein
MKSIITALATAVLLTSAGAFAAPLTIGVVGSMRLECTYANSCVDTFDETVGNLAFTNYGSVAGVYTRTVTGEPTSWSGGKTGYLYRVDVTGSTFGECIHGIVLGVDAIDKVNYTLSGWTDLVVVNSGWLGSIGVASANFDAVTHVLEIYFDKYVCPGETTFFFGFSSASAARTPVFVNLLMAGDPPLLQAKARVP